MAWSCAASFTISGFVNHEKQIDLLKGVLNNENENNLNVT